MTLGIELYQNICRFGQLSGIRILQYHLSRQMCSCCCIRFLEFNFLTTDSNMNSLKSISEESEDLRETIDAHTACHCTKHCA